jgi:hypothetical protein
MKLQVQALLLGRLAIFAFGCGAPPVGVLPADGGADDAGVSQTQTSIVSEQPPQVIACKVIAPTQC